MWSKIGSADWSSTVVEGCRRARLCLLDRLRPRADEVKDSCTSSWRQRDKRIQLKRQWPYDTKRCSGEEVDYQINHCSGSTLREVGDALPSTRNLISESTKSHSNGEFTGSGLTKVIFTWNQVNESLSPSGITRLWLRQFGAKWIRSTDPSRENGVVTWSQPLFCFRAADMCL